MKVLSTEGLTKLIQLIKSSFISSSNTEEVSEVDLPIGDNSTIIENASNQLQAVAVKDSNNGNAIRVWTGTKTEYNALKGLTLYCWTDDADRIYTESDIPQIGDNIYDANGNLLGEVDSYSDSTLMTNNPEYSSIYLRDSSDDIIQQGQIDANTQYTLTDTGEIYLGSSSVSGANTNLSNITSSGKLVITEQIGNRTRKDISSLVSDGTLSKAVAEQNLEKYGINIGDYFTGASGYEYIVADLDTYYTGTNVYASVNKHHVCLVVNTKQNQAWNYSTTIKANNITFTYDSTGSNYYAWKNGNTTVYTAVRQPAPNSTKAYSNTALTTEYATVTDANGFTTGGYVASNLHSYLTGTALPKVQSDIATLTGEGYRNHLLSHQKIYSTAMDSARYNRYGLASGSSSSWAWSTNQYISALTEAQVYGSIIWSSAGYDTGEAWRQLEVFRKFRSNYIITNATFWLRDIANSSHAVYSIDYGSANSSSTRYVDRVVGLIMFY